MIGAQGTLLGRGQGEGFRAAVAAEQMGRLARNFTVEELACPHCGVCEMDPDFVARLQHMRDIVGRPIIINSAYRCAFHEWSVGGTGGNHPWGRAADLHAPTRAEKRELYEAAQRAGMLGFGKYQTFLHVDTTSAREWFYNSRARELWKGI